jgi:4-amino-4-deoxychorismate lyase
MASFLVNGWPAQSIDTANRGLAYGDGVFRTLLVREGRALNWARHFRLLQRDCAMIGIRPPEEALVLDEIARLAPASATVKVIVTRGSSGRGYAYNEDLMPTRIVVAYPSLPLDPGPAEDGITARRCDLVLGEQPRLAGVKSLNRLENVLARAEWRDPAIREGFICDAAGRLVEGTMSNVFVVKAGAVATPDLSRCGVIGAQRERVRDLLAAEGIACTECDVPFAALAEADEIFITNSVIGVWPVVRSGPWARPPGPVTRRIQRLVAADDAAAPQ